jgi:hypothetical protein
LLDQLIGKRDSMYATKEEIQRDGKLSAYGANGELDCPYPVGSAAYKVWMEAYKQECSTIMDEVEAVYDWYHGS